MTVGELRKAGMRQKLAGQPFQVLQALLERPGEIITREELRQRLWPDNIFVDYELALKKAVNRLREVLGDSADSPHFIETIPRRGYRFIGTIAAPPSVPSDFAERPIVGAVETAEAHVGGPKSETRKSRKLVGSVVLAGIATVLLWANADRLRTRIFAKSRSVEIHSIAVLPLQNLSTDPREEYFSEGITEALTTDLAQISALRVISRTSSEHFKGSRETLPEIARQLNVEAVVEGSVTRSENRVRITAQLIEAQSDRHLWAKTYDRDFQDILRLQDEVARDIAAEIRISVTPQEQARLTLEQKTNPSAYEAYLRGRYLWSQRNAESIDKAASYFQQAAREDPAFALAYSGLSDCYWVGWGAKIDLPLADRYATKAVALQPELAEAHASLGIVRLNEYQMSGAERELKRAIELNPNYAMAHHFYSGYLLSVGRTVDALKENDLARRLDPFSIPVNTARVIILVGSRNYGEAIEQAEKNRELAPQSPVPHNSLARLYWLEGKAPEAIAEERKAATLKNFPQWLRSLDEVAATFEKSGLRAAELNAAQFMERSYQGNLGDYEAIFVAFQYGNLENKSKVLQWLEESRRTYDGNLYLALKTAPEFDFLRKDPRFQDLLRRLNLAGG
ncbi:MAG: hypothetical protein DMG37_14760 [Acidobacteria bacterium]|nr:MAG: hypothetical protein DMG37_14760 [Acidobacteriota bacterium]